MIKKRKPHKIDPKRIKYKYSWGSGDVEIEDAPETFQADLRGSGPGARSKPLRAVNEYQRELESIYTAWSRETAQALTGIDDPQERDDLIGERLAALLLLLRNAGRTALPQALALGAGDAPTPEMYAELLRMMQENDQYLEDSLIPALREKLQQAFNDEDILAALALSAATGQRAIEDTLRTRIARVAYYAGAFWALYCHTFGLNLTGQGKRVRWKLEALANHCGTCLEFGDKNYESFEAMLAVTGGVYPSHGTDCGNNCRCVLVEA
jgi:hypothetical protein